MKDICFFKTLILLVLFMTFSRVAYCQYSISDSFPKERGCFTSHMMELNAKKFPKIVVQRSPNNISSAGFIVIPVVVHVIHENGIENLSDAMIKSQINVLNEDFGNYGVLDNDDRAVDTRIRFCLAQRDPDGNPTTGIIRVVSPYTDLNDSNEMLTKNLSHWDPHRYFNIWVVRSINGSSNIQGYSYIPAESGGPAFVGDGTVIVYKYFGRPTPFNYFAYHMGRTTVHETGHYLNLQHTWGPDGACGCFVDDGIADTPQDSCQFFSVYPSCPKPVQCGKVRMIENYMDYSLDGCMKLYTEGQKERMQTAINLYRAMLVSYSNLTGCGCDQFSDSINSTANLDFFPNPVFSDTLKIKTHNLTPANLTFSIYDLYGRLIKEVTFSNVINEIVKLNITQFRPGMYIFRGQFLNKKFVKKIVIPYFRK